MLERLPGAQEALKSAAEAVHSGATRVGIHGPEGAGKTSVLEALEVELAREGHRVLSLPFVRRGDDAAALGLVTLGTQLGQVALLEELKRPEIPFGEKLKHTLQAVQRESKPVVLMDAPALRSANEPPSVFSLRSEELVSRVLGLENVVTIVAGQAPRIAGSIRVQPTSVPGPMLAQTWATGLQPGITALRTAKASKLARYSPLELRLLIALAARAPENVDALVNRRQSPRQLVEGALAGREELCLVLFRLGRCRVPFDDVLLERAGASTLGTDDRELLEQVVLIQTAAGRTVHEMIARHLPSPDADPNEAHQLLARWHREQFERAQQQASVAAAMRHEMEYVHQLTECGDAQGVLDAAVYFAEQFDALGKVLSIRRRYSEAVQAYERALQHDPGDAYAHHYLAWNLDIEAEDKERVYSEYTEARDLDPSHVWYHGRRVCFLITTGRLEDAKDGWAEALAALESDRIDDYIATELHRPVAQLLLYRGQLDFAASVLADVPKPSRSSDWYTTLWHRLDELREAERDELVFPPSLTGHDRWDGPHLLRAAEDRSLVQVWMPGRISWADGDELRVRVAQRDVEGNVRFSYREFSHDELVERSAYPQSGLSLPAGTFVEVWQMADGAERLLSWPRERKKLPGVGEIIPAPDRYIRRALGRA